MELEGKKVIVVGMGKSGVAAARLCHARGARVVGTDAQPQAKLSEAARTLPIELRCGGHADVPFDHADLVVVSPGVPPLPELARAEAAGVSVIGELELGFRFSRAPVCCIGGTNGKSTTTTLAAGMFEQAGLSVFDGGNLGTPLCEAVGEQYDVLLVEVSSFQLERAPTFRPHVSVLLNVSEDHLDRYPSLDAYAEAKGRAFFNQRGDDFAVVPVGDPVCLGQARRGDGKVVTFGEGGDYAVGENEVIEAATNERFSLAAAHLSGRHNQLNAAAAVAAIRSWGIAGDSIERGLGAFTPLPHRMAFVGELEKIRFYDDSKGTNVGAAVTALLSLEEDRGVLIAGGRDKQGSYDALVRALERKGRALVVIGEAAGRIAEAVGSRVAVQHASSMKEAVEMAFRLARPGDAVLLSPACSSFDMFSSYAERGQRFVAAVSRLTGASAEEACG